MNVLRDRDMRVKFFLRWARTIKRSIQNHCYFRHISCRERTRWTGTLISLMSEKSAILHTVLEDSEYRENARKSRTITEWIFIVVHIWQLALPQFLTARLQVIRGLSFSVLLFFFLLRSGIFHVSNVVFSVKTIFSFRHQGVLSFDILFCFSKTLFKTIF